jgi:hypothetical protein
MYHTRQLTPRSTAVAAELAAEQRRSQFPSAITVDDALKHVGTDEMVEWLGWMAAGDSWQNVTAELVHKLTDDDARTVLSSVVTTSSHSVGHLLNAVLRSAVAKHISDIANDMAGDPIDDDMTAYSPALMEFINARYGT